MTLHTLYSLETWVTRSLAFSVQSVCVKDISCRYFVCSTAQSERVSHENKLIYFPGYNDRRQSKCNILRNRLHEQRNLEHLSLFIYLELRLQIDYNFSLSMNFMIKEMMSTMSKSKLKPPRLCLVIPLSWRHFMKN